MAEKKYVDPFYKSKRWERLRKAVLARDGYRDQLELKAGRNVNAYLVHHILPREMYPEYQYEAWNLISLSKGTHNSLHNPISKDLTAAGRRLMLETAEKHGIKLSRLTLVIGLPGSGKSTWVRRHLGGGLVYDLDYIAAAFRLTQPHAERHEPARKLANGMVRAFAQNARRYVSNVYVIRSAPRLEEVIDLDPDSVVVCTGSYSVKARKDSRPLDADELAEKIKEIEEWAAANGIICEHIPPYM